MKDKMEMHLSNLMVVSGTSYVTLKKVSITTDEDEGKATGFNPHKTAVLKLLVCTKREAEHQVCQQRQIHQTNSLLDICYDSNLRSVYRSW